LIDQDLGHLLRRIASQIKPIPSSHALFIFTQGSLSFPAGIAENPLAGQLIKLLSLKPFNRDIFQGMLMIAEIPTEVFDRFDNNIQQDIFFSAENQSRFPKKHFGFLYVAIQTDVVGQ
jgi:hypothetical protein